MRIRKIGSARFSREREIAARSREQWSFAWKAIRCGATLQRLRDCRAWRLRLLRNESDLADPSFPQPVAPEPVGGQQLLQWPATDLRGNVSGIGGERVYQRIRHGTVGPAAVLLPADNQPDPLQGSEHFLQRGEPDRVGVRHALSL